MFRIKDLAIYFNLRIRQYPKVKFKGNLYISKGNIFVLQRYVFHSHVDNLTKMNVFPVTGKWFM